MILTWIVTGIKKIGVVPAGPERAAPPKVGQVLSVVFLEDSGMMGAWEIN